MSSILIIDDDQSICSTLSILLARNGYAVDTASTVTEAEGWMKKSIYDLVITDLKMPEASGLEITKMVKTATPETEVIMITGHGSIDTAVKALQEGAADYLTKPFTDEEMLILVKRVLQHHSMKTELKHLKRAFAEQFNFDKIIGNSQAIKAIIDVVKQIAPQDINVLINGDSGTGKELFAKAIHNNSPRRQNKFVAINCSAMPDLLLESELFGHVKGAFTSAATNKKGLFEEAEGGTIFLDEVGDMSASLQSKLLRVLQEEEIRPVGSTQISKISVRVLAATNKRLEELVSVGRFREDLYYRLNVISLDIPSLNERKEDIVPLAYHFLHRYCKHFVKPEKKFSNAACQKLTAHNWPGNVRELENTIKRAVALSTFEIIDIDNLFLMTPLLRLHETKDRVQLNANKPLADVQREHILGSLKENNWNYSVTASKLGIGRTTLWRKVKKYNLVKQ